MKIFKKIAEWISATLNISWNALNLIIIFGVIFGLCAFEKVNGMDEAKLSYYGKVSVEQIYQAGLTPTFHLYWIGFKFLISYCVEGFLILLVFTEIYVRGCEILNKKNNRFYRFLAHKDK